MAAKVIAGILTLVLNVGAGVFVFLSMLLAMNGFHESDAQWGIAAYVIIAILVSVAMTIGAILLVGALIRKQFSGILAAVIAVFAFSIVGIAMKVVGGLLGILLADFVRVNF